MFGKRGGNFDGMNEAPVEKPVVDIDSSAAVAEKPDMAPVEPAPAAPKTPSVPATPPPPPASSAPAYTDKSEEYYDTKTSVFSALIDTIDLGQLAQMEPEAAREEIRDIVNDIISIKNLAM